ncbi:MAG: Na/Pi cotransporter family protein [Bacteroidales bacterium]|nr:Na/Pi cotransporter family protein [Bacteroidales bacterium]MDE6871426.1 Na/Pi cotransporter family protein [Bacteroidales bacterium]MDE7126733.1 Na/Pi cotransporter family protein [Bacteroidales bacterium]
MHIVLLVFTLLGALGMFLYGMTLMSESLQKAAGDRLRSFLASMTSTPFKQVLTGTAITTLVQSSSATTVMVVSFVNAGLITLANAVGVIMGANVGTIPTIWITSFGFSMDISVISLPLMAIGFVMMSSKTAQSKNIGGFIIGFAMLFLGLSLMKENAEAILSDEYRDAMMAFFGYFTGYGFGSVLIFLLVGAVLTMVLQASSATMAITMLLATTGLIGFDLAAAMVIGENIGTTITANMAASVGNTSAKRAAMAHTVYNVFGAIWVLVLYHPFLKLVGFTVSAIGLSNPLSVNLSDPSAQMSLLFGIAILHTMFKLINTLILVWFIPSIVKTVTMIVKAPEGEEEEVFRLKYITGGLLSTAELSLDEAKQEITYFAELCQKGYGYIRQAINEQNPEKFAELNKKLVKYEDITDRIEFEIASYLNEVSNGDLSERSDYRIKAMYKIIGELESLGDSGEAIGRILQRKNAHNKVFDEDMLSKLNLMLDTVQTAYDAMLENLRKPYEDVNDITNAQNAEDAINSCRNRLREEHIANIENDSYNYQTGVYYMDVLAELERIGDFIINVSQAEEAVR